MHPNKEARATDPRGGPKGFGRDKEREDDRVRGRPARADLNATTGEADPRPVIRCSPDLEGQDERRRPAWDRWRHAPPTD